MSFRHFYAFLYCMLFIFEVHGAVIKVAAGTDGIAAAYTSAASGDTIELTTSGGYYIESSALTVTGKAITIRAAANLAEKPIWACSYVSTSGGIIKTYAGLTLNGVILDGTASSTSTVNAIITSGTGYNIRATNTVFRNFTIALYGSGTGVQVDTLIYKNCVFNNISGNAIIFYTGSLAPGAFKYLAIKNSTFWNAAYSSNACLYSMANDALYSPNAGWTADPRVEIDHVTIYNFRRLYCKEHTNVLITNTIFSIASSTSSTGFSVVGDLTSVKNCMYYNVSNSFGTGVDTSKIINANPLFAKAATGDFSLTTSSPANLAGTDGHTLGDSRWWPAGEAPVDTTPLPPSDISLAAGKNVISQAMQGLKSGQSIILTSADGIYEESTPLLIDKPVVIKAADGLSSKPIITLTSGDAIIELSNDLTLNGVVLDGAKSGSTIPSGITNTAGSSIHKLIVTNTDFLNLKDASSVQGYGIIGKSNSMIENVSISGCSFVNIAKNGISFQSPANPSGSVRNLKVENVTFSNIGADAVYADGFDSDLKKPDADISINQVTAYNCGGNTFTSSNIDSVVISNSIVALSSLNNAVAPAKIYGANSKVQNLLYFNTGAVALGTGASSSQLTSIVAQQNPQFTDAAAGTFSYPATSPAVVKQQDGSYIRLGDKKWWPDLIDYTPKNIHWGTHFNSLRGLTVTWNNVSTDDSLRWGYTSNFEKGAYPGVRRLNDYKTGVYTEYLYDYTFPVVNPSSVLYYSIKANGVWNPVKTFKTSVDTASSKFSFVTGGDQQTSGPAWEKMSNLAAAENADFYIMVGDIVDNSTYPSWWKLYYDTGAKYLESTLNYYTHGNHVYFGGESDKTTLNQLVLPGNEKWYSFKQGNTLFVCLLSEDELTTQWPYIRDVLANTDATWIVVYFHRPFFTSSGHAGEMDSMIPYWWKAFDDYGVNVVINGHVHTYTRSKPINLNISGLAPVQEYGSSFGKGRLQMLAGSMGAPKYNLETGWWVDSTESVWNYVKFNIDGNKLHFDAIDENKKIIDSLTIYTDGERHSSLVPGFYFVAPGLTNDTVSNDYLVKWTDSVDPSDSANARVSLYYTTDTSKVGTLIAGDIKINDETNSAKIGIKSIPVGTYYVYAIVSNGVRTLKRYATGKLVIIEDVVPPPAAKDLKGTMGTDRVTLTWLNPTRNVYVEKQLATFENGLENFSGVADGGSTGSVAISDAGYSGKGLQINYNIAAAWEQYAGVQSYTNTPNFSSTPTLDFWYKGDGSSRNIRIIAEQDNDANGKSDDWWFDESLDISSTQWKHAQLSLPTFSSLGWHANVKSSFDLTNMYSMDFIVPSSTPGSGSILLDEIKVTGYILPAPDFQGVVVVRKDGAIPASVNDGEIVYQGKAETCVDSTLAPNTVYYYAVFAFDMKPNYSILDSTSVWKSGVITGIMDSKVPIKYELNQNYPNPFNPSTIIRYGIPKAGNVNIEVFNMIGQRVRTLVSEYQKEGYYHIEFNASNLPSGIYFLHMKSASFVNTKKMLFLK